MAWILKGLGDANDDGLVQQMFEERKRVFVDILGWDVPVLEGRYEVDQFDNERAVYLIVDDGHGRHLGSARLLSTTREHILGSIFPHLCAGPIPSGDKTLEITRFCLSPEVRARERLSARKRLVSALAEYAIRTDVEAFTGVAEKAWFDQIAAFGWDCRSLGPPEGNANRALVGLHIDIGPDTISGLRRMGNYAEVQLRNLDTRLAA
jgi:acyl-homoserine lactone synthase